MGYPQGVLKPTKIGNGFEKESVLAYIDDLQQKVNQLEDEKKELEERQSAEESQLVQDYKRSEEDAKKKARLLRKKLLKLTKNSRMLSTRPQSSPKLSRPNRKAVRLISRKSRNSWKKLRLMMLMLPSSRNTSRKLWN